MSDTFMTPEPRVTFMRHLDWRQHLDGGYWWSDILDTTHPERMTIVEHPEPGQQEPFTAPAPQRPYPGRVSSKPRPWKKQFRLLIRRVQGQDIQYPTPVQILGEFDTVDEAKEFARNLVGDPPPHED